LRRTLLRASFSHQDIADLVGASRPRATEHLAQLERERLVIRQGRQLIECVDEIGNTIGVHPGGKPDQSDILLTGRGKMGICGEFLLAI
jgi:hypothetical protein